MKPRLIRRSLADIPAGALSLAASMPGRAVNASRDVVRSAMRVSRRELRAAGHESAALARDLYARADAPFRSAMPWQRGGLNE